MTVRQGQTVEQDHIGQVPPGTVLSDNYSRKGVMLDNGYVVEVGGTGQWPLYSLRGWCIESVPEVTPQPRLNIEAFKQRVRTVCYGAALQHGVAIGPVFTALGRIGANDASPPLGVGMHVHLSDSDLYTRIGRKGGVTLGHGDPNFWDSYAEFDYRSERARMGGVRQRSWTLEVLTMDRPDTEAYLRPPTEEDEREIARLRGVIWQIGVRAKAEQRWCEAFETALAVLGISSNAVTQVTAEQPEIAGDERFSHPVDERPIIRDWAEVRAYPDGAVFEYFGGSPSADEGRRAPNYEADTQWNWMRRSRTGRFDTRNFIGPNGGQHGGPARVLWDGEGPMRIPIYRSLMRHLPVGTRLSTHSGTYYEKMAHGDAGWRSNGRIDMSATRDRDFFGGAQQTSDSWWISALPDRWEYGANCSNRDGNA